MNYTLNSASRSRILQAIGKLQGEWQIEIKPYRKRRTDSQNKRYFKLVTMAAEVVGCSKEELHREMKGAYFGWNEFNIGPKRFREPKESSARLNSKEFADFMTWAEEKFIQYTGVWLA